MNYVAIMAGGIGSRFWPASRNSRPKQFLDILGVGKSLLRLTYERFLSLVPSENVYVVTNEQYAQLVKEQLPELNERQIIAEPSRNNTAPSVAYTAFRLQAQDAGANIVMAPSDHIILKEDVFLKNINKALQLTAGQEVLCTLGITANRPDTGYGYIYFEKAGSGGTHKVISFREKPDLAQAEAYVNSGQYLWNAGIFIWRASVILESFRKLAPTTYQILKAGKGRYGTDDEHDFIAENYPKTENISVDFAILERADNVFTIPSDIGWSDLGTWASLHAESPQDQNGNVIQGDQVLPVSVQNTLIRKPPGKLVVVKGLENYIIVDEGDALLIWPKGQEQGIREVNKLIKKAGWQHFL